MSLSPPRILEPHPPQNHLLSTNTHTLSTPISSASPVDQHKHSPILFTLIPFNQVTERADILDGGESDEDDQDWFVGGLKFKKHVDDAFRADDYVTIPGGQQKEKGKGKGGGFGGGVFPKEDRGRW